MEPDSEIDRLEWEQLKLNSLLEEVRAIRAAVKPFKKISHDPIQKYDDLLRTPKFSELMGRYRTSPSKPLLLKRDTINRLANPLPTQKNIQRRDNSLEPRPSRRDVSIERKLKVPSRRETFITEARANHRGGNGRSD